MALVSVEVLDELRSNKNDLLVIASWFYKIGSPIISDNEFDVLESEVGGLDYVWDDMIEPKELLSKYNIEYDYSNLTVIGDNKYFNVYMDSLYDYDTSSISPMYTYNAIYDRIMWLKENTDKLNISLKVDGVSTRSIIEYSNGEWNLVASLSRSRTSKGFDYTDGMKLIVKSDLKFGDDVGDLHEVSGNRLIFAFGECYVERNSLDYLRNKYGKVDTWKTPRSTALSMLRDIINEEDYKYLKFKCFKLNIGRTLTEMFEIASNAGLNVVPYEIIETSDIPTHREEWNVWFNKLLDKYYNIQESLDIEADGIVVSVDNQDDFNSMGKSTNLKYNNAMFSCKVGHWGSKVYTSEVVDIDFDNKGNTSEYSVVAIIKPVKVFNGNTVTRVNCFNLKILIENKINIGSVIKFEYKSASSIVLVYK